MSRPRADAAAVSPGDPPGTAAEDARTADDLDGLAGLIADWMRRPLRGAPIVTLNRIAWAPVAEDRPDDPWHRAAAAVDAAAAGEDRPGGPAERAALAAIADHPPGPRARALRAALAVRLAGLHGMAGAADRVLLPAGPAPDPEALLVVGRACRPFTAPYLAALEALAAGPAAGAPPSRHAILALRLWLGLAMAFSADAATLDALDRWIAALRAEGVYVWLDLHTGRKLMPADGLDGYEELKEGEMRGFAYVSPGIQERMEMFQEAYLGHLNPLTGLSYAEDPAILAVLLTNENDVTHHFGNALLPGKGAPEFWVAVVKPGRVVYEVEGVNGDGARAALQREFATRRRVECGMMTSSMKPRCAAMKGFAKRSSYSFVRWAILSGSPSLLRPCDEMHSIASLHRGSNSNRSCASA